MIKNYFGIKRDDIQNNKQRDYKSWEIIHIEAYNYHEAKIKLKNMELHHDYYLIPRTVLEHRDMTKANKIYKGII